MKLHRFFGEFDFTKPIIKIIEPSILNQFRNVLRFEKNDMLILCNGKAEEAKVRIRSLDRNTCELEIVEVTKNKNESEVYGILYVSLLKRENFEWVLQKATEVGIRAIFPVITERTVKLGFKKERFEKIVKEAVEQSERGMIPKISEPISFDDAVIMAKKNDLNLFCDRTGGIFSAKFTKGNIGVFIGPEGGWTEAELAAARNSKFEIVQLSSRTLRAETAAVIAAYLISN